MFRKLANSLPTKVGSQCFHQRIISNQYTAYSTITKSDDIFVENIVKKLKDGDRASLATVITLVETEHKMKRKTAQKILNKILEDSKIIKSIRIGLSGPPGAGKSSFIEVLGKYLAGMGKRVAVLAVDPSSTTTGGSLLGDKTRMPELTRDPNAFIRPSPTRGHLGGVTRSTNEAILVCEYAGYDIIIVETVGVGQSEYAVCNMVDIFVLLLSPGGGDELQGVKRGIVEKADILLVTKSDGDLEGPAHRTQYEFTAALKFIRSQSDKWKPKVLRVSSKTKEGLDSFWNAVCKYQEDTRDDFDNKRAAQRVVWMWTHVNDGLQAMLLLDPKISSLTESLKEKVRDGKMSPGVASDIILTSIQSLIHSNK